jgi:hypothetical protein
MYLAVMLPMPETLSAELFEELTTTPHDGIFKSMFPMIAKAPGAVRLSA